MSKHELIKPKTIELPDVDGEMHSITLSRIPYMPLGREIALSGALSALPKVGDYRISEDIAYKMLALIEINPVDGDPIRLDTKALVANHILDPVLGGRIEMAMIAYNFDFFGKGGFSGFLQDSLKTHLPSIIQTVTQLLPPSLQQGFADGMNSAKNTTSKT